MADQKGGGGPSEASKRRIEYNLEKEPLQTGRLDAGIDLRTQAAMGDSVRTAQRRLGGSMFLFLVCLLLFVASVLVYFTWDILAELVELIKSLAEEA